MRVSYEIWCERRRKWLRWRWRCLRKCSAAPNDQPNAKDYIMSAFVSERLPALRRICYLIGSCVSAVCRVQAQQQPQHTQINIMCVSAGTFFMLLLMQIIWFSKARDVCLPSMTTFDKFQRLKPRSKFQVEKKRKKSCEDHIHRIIGNNFFSNFSSFPVHALRESRILYSFNIHKQIFIIILCA